MTLAQFYINSVLQIWKNSKNDLGGKRTSRLGRFEYMSVAFNS